MIDHNILRDLFGNYGNILLTADHHFGHANIIGYISRPFADAQEMDNQMIARWNVAVQANDVVIHLGDFTLSSHQIAMVYLSNLNGNILFVTPHYHHDKRWIGTLPCKTMNGRAVYHSPFCLLSGELARIDSGHITLCHYPLEEWDRSFHGALHFHGHTHGALRVIQNRLDVGVDCQNFTPILLSKAVRLASSNRRTV